MIEDNYIINKEKITSFMIECLIYNVPNVIIVNNSLWNEKIRNVIMYLFKEIDNSLEWMEVSGGLYLFNNNRKWTRNDVKQFLSQIYIYMGYNV